jgi:small subunit ribosomal protein S1
MRRTTIRRRDGEADPLPDPIPSQPQEPAPPPKPAARTSEPHRHLDKDDLEAIASMSADELAALMDQSASRLQIEPGTRVTGRVTRVGKDNVFIDLGAKSEAMLEREDLPDAKVGDEVTAYVIEVDENGIQLAQKITGSTAMAMIEQAKGTNIPVEGLVTARNPGGFEVKIGSVRAFCPASQMDRHADPDPDRYIGMTLEFNVVEVGDRDVVLSRRALVEGENVIKREKFWLDAKIGDTFQGTVSNATTFGVFVDIGGGVEGLVPKRELSWEDGNSDPMASYPRGRKVAVRVVDLDHEKRKITLSARDPSMAPWMRVGADFVQGGIYDGTVARVEAYGAFVELTPGLVGLLHGSRAGRNLPKPGEHIQVRITAIDQERQRLELSSADPSANAPVASDEPGAMVKGVVREVLKNGLVIDLEDGNTGWIPSREIDLPAGTILPQRFRVGKEVQGRVVEADPSRRRVTMSLRAETEEGNWRSTQTGSQGASLGTFADLLSGFKQKK